MKKITALMLCAVLILLIGCEAEINESMTESDAVSQTASEVSDTSEASGTADDSSVPDDTSEPDVVKDVYYEGYTGSKKELVLKLDYGTEDGKIAMGDAFTKRNTEDFLIYNGEYHILDSVAYRIQVFDEDGGFLRSIDFKEYDEYELVRQFDYNGSEYAVLLYSGEGSYENPTEIMLLYIDASNNKYILDVDEWLTENGVDVEPRFYLADLRFEDDALRLCEVTHFDGIVRFSEDGIASIEAVENKLAIEFDEEKVVYTTENGSFTVEKDEISQESSGKGYVYGANGHIYLYELYSFDRVMEPERFSMVEARMSEYSPEGELIQYAIIEKTRDLVGDPDIPYCISESGDLYYMYSLEDGVYIYRVEMGNTAISAAQYLYHQLDEID